MPKKKTRKGAAKRFKISARGKILFTKSGKGHLLTGKSRRRKRRLSRRGVLTGAAAKKIAVMLMG
jgi:large subunit ribosomal protein L35